VIATLFRSAPYGTAGKPLHRRQAKSDRPIKRSPGTPVDFLQKLK
jgi:hypothetical protein